MQQTKLKQTDNHTHACTAESLCARRGLRLTRVRRLVLDFLLKAKVPFKAYDILDALRHGAPKALTPASIYRSLDYLLQEGLVHRVGTLNAYVACAETCEESCKERHAPVFMLVCPGCRKSRELNDPDLYQTIFSTMQRQGFMLQGDTVELTGICPRCAHEDARAAAQGHEPNYSI